MDVKCVSDISFTVEVEILLIFNSIWDSDTLFRTDFVKKYIFFWLNLLLSTEIETSARSILLFCLSKGDKGASSSV